SVADQRSRNVACRNGARGDALCGICGSPTVPARSARRVALQAEDLHPARELYPLVLPTVAVTPRRRRASYRVSICRADRRGERYARDGPAGVDRARRDVAGFALASPATARKAAPSRPILGSMVR